MSFYLKKFISIFLQPLMICFILLGTGLYFMLKKEPDYKKAKKLFIAATIWLFIISWEPLTSLYIAPFENSYPTHLNKTNATFKYIAVLSSGHTDDNRLPPTEQQGFQSLYRLVEGVRLQKLYPEAKLIFSGYEYRGQRPNSEVSKEAAIILGADPEKIVLLNGTKDTIEESIAIKKVVGNEPILLVTSASHMLRSMALMKGQDINATAAPAQFHNKGKTNFFQTPGSGAINDTERAIYETAGYMWGWISGRY